MKKIWSDDAWDDYLYWQMQDKKTLKRINQLVLNLLKNGITEDIAAKAADMPLAEVRELAKKLSA